MLLSRVANACFWLSRYRERAEFTARLVDVNLHTLLDTSGLNDGVDVDWESIIQINGCMDKFENGERVLDLPNALFCLCMDPANPNSIASCLRTVRENARQAREQISSEMWEQANDMYHEINHLSEPILYDHPHEVLQSIKTGSLLFQGLTGQTMMHGEAWHFIELGRFMERANTTCRLLAARADPRRNSEEQYRSALHWIVVLKSVSSLEAYHKTFAAPVSANAAIEFLLLNEDLPRSILYCVENIHNALTFISGSTGRRFGNEAERLAGQLASRLHYLRLEDIDLLPYLMEIQTTLYYISDSMT